MKVLNAQRRIIDEVDTIGKQGGSTTVWRNKWIKREREREGNVRKDKRYSGQPLGLRLGHVSGWEEGTKTSAYRPSFWVFL